MIFKGITETEVSKNENSVYSCKNIQAASHHWNDFDYIKDLLQEIESIIISGRDFDDNFCKLLITIMKQNHRLGDVKIFNNKEDPNHLAVVFISETKNVYKTAPFEEFMELKMKKENKLFTIFEVHQKDIEKDGLIPPSNFEPNEDLDRKMFKYQMFV
jgi:hypothetical protein